MVNIKEELSAKDIQAYGEFLQWAEANPEQSCLWGDRFEMLKRCGLRIGVHGTLIEQLRRERNRMRAALEKIASGQLNPVAPLHRVDCIQIAKEALSGDSVS